MRTFSLLPPIPFIIQIPPCWCFHTPDIDISIEAKSSECMTLYFIDGIC